MRKQVPGHNSFVRRVSAKCRWSIGRISTCLSLEPISNSKLSHVGSLSARPCGPPMIPRLISRGPSHDLHSGPIRCGLIRHGLCCRLSRHGLDHRGLDRWLRCEPRHRGLSRSVPESIARRANTETQAYTHDSIRKRCRQTPFRNDDLLLHKLQVRASSE